MSYLKQLNYLVKRIQEYYDNPGRMKECNLCKLTDGCRTCLIDNTDKSGWSLGCLAPFVHNSVIYNPVMARDKPGKDRNMWRKEMVRRINNNLKRFNIGYIIEVK